MTTIQIQVIEDNEDFYMSPCVKYINIETDHYDAVKILERALTKLVEKEIQEEAEK